jgi:hypothetical protein
MRVLAPLLLLAAVGRPAPAAEIPYYRMDSLAFLASDIVLADEVRYETRKDRWGWDYPEATLTVVRALRGSCEPKQRLTVALDGTYTRIRVGDASGDKRPTAPMGRALMFLKKDEDGRWRPVAGGVKLIMGGEAYCYGQFRDQPGPLWLARMAPENIEVPADAKYGEAELLTDLAAALEKAKGLAKAEARRAVDPGIIRQDCRQK